MQVPSLLSKIAGKTGRSTSATIAKTATAARSSGGMAKAMEFAGKNKGKIGMGVAAGVAGMGLARTRRSGLNRTSGRPTGMYKY